MRLPPVTRSLRFRISGMTAAVVFGIGGMALAAVYFVALRAIQSVTMTELVAGEPVLLDDQRVVVPFSAIERRTLESELREVLLNKLVFWIVIVMALLFVASLIVGWIVANRSLKPLDEITLVAQEIEATDLDRRIGIDGPDDELTRMARIFDSMLDRLSASFRAQQRFLAQTSHDLRTPLAVIRSNLEVTSSDPQATAEEWRETGEIVIRAADRMSTMVDDLLATARLEMRGHTLDHRDLSTLVADSVAELEATATAAGVTLVADDPDEPPRIPLDEDLIRRALSNLIENAIRHAPAGSEVRVAVRQTDEWIHVGVVDAGPGVDPELVSGERPGSGGMGLAIVRQVVSMHGGRLTAASTERGSIVSMALPIDNDSVGVAHDAVDLAELYDRPRISDTH